MKPVAIVGRSPSTHHEAPWVDPSWEVWGLPWDPGYWSQYDRFFEMHPREELEKAEADRPEEYQERLALDIDWGPIYMQQFHADIPMSVPYPFDEINADVFANFPRAWDQVDYYNSSPAYMLAMAIHEKRPTIGLWGIDCSGESEYAYELPNLTFLIGLAVGRGIEVVIPEGPTNLLKFHGVNVPFGNTSLTYKSRYGFT